MQTRSRTYLQALFILLIVLSAATVLAQDSSHRSKPAGTPAVTDYVSLMLTLPGEETSPEVRAVMGEFFAFIRRECAAIAVANRAQLEEEARWLDQLQRKAATEYQRVKRYWTAAAPPSPSKIILKWVRKTEEAQIGLAAVEVIQSALTGCISERKRELQSGPDAGGEEVSETAEEPGIYKELYHRWSVSCRSAKGIQAPTSGVLTLILDGRELGGYMKYSSHGNVGLQFSYLESTVLGSNGSFRLSTPAGAGNQIVIEGPASGDPPARSGTIRMGGEVEGYGTWNCTGTWQATQ